jgi:hypothetical protein
MTMTAAPGRNTSESAPNGQAPRRSGGPRKACLDVAALFAEILAAPKLELVTLCP